jgi:hypothetical protein
MSVQYYLTPVEMYDQKSGVRNELMRTENQMKQFSERQDVDDNLKQTVLNRGTQYVLNLKQQLQRKQIQQAETSTEPIAATPVIIDVVTKSVPKVSRAKAALLVEEINKIESLAFKPLQDELVYNNEPIGDIKTIFSYLYKTRASKKETPPHGVEKVLEILRENNVDVNPLITNQRYKQEIRPASEPVQRIQRINKIEATPKTPQRQKNIQQRVVQPSPPRLTNTVNAGDSPIFPKKWTEG